MENTKQKFVFVETPTFETAQPSEPAAIQRATTNSISTRKSILHSENRLLNAVVRGLLIAFLVVDAAIIGLLANYFFMGK